MLVKVQFVKPVYCDFDDDNETTLVVDDAGHAWRDLHGDIYEMDADCVLAERLHELADVGSLPGRKVGPNVFTYGGGLISIVFEINEPYPDVVARLGFAAHEAENVGGGAGAPDVLDLDVADLDQGGPTQVTLVPWAVLLIKHNGVSSIDHGEVDEVEVGYGECGWGGGPRLDPDPVLGAGEGAPLHGYPFDVLLLHVPPQTADADAVAGPALHVPDEDVVEVVPHGDAVVSRLDDGVEDPDVVASGDVDAVSVRAVTGGGDSEALEGDVATGDAVDMEALAVLGGDVLDDGVGYEVQAQVDGELHAILVFVAVIPLPGLLALPVEHATPRDGQVVHGVDCHPFLALHGELGRIPVGLQGASHRKVDRGLVWPLHVGLAQCPMPFWDQDLAWRC
ncbi:hypothetical protein SASPL_135031 [Salvia splendens]|uniref:Uncharacterized protein n=1 Tax=Salvia splendens TaxID=180675 RepID=A0A8X8WX45_SALSN|nr:hypothetical protein SASPL_135031 [Salvia splendens]